MGGTVREVLEAIATTPPPLLREVAVGVPEDLQAICLACLAWNPADRPSASEIGLELGRFIVGEPVQAPAETVRRSSSAGHQRILRPGAEDGPAKALFPTKSAIPSKLFTAGCSRMKIIGSSTHDGSRCRKPSFRRARGWQSWPRRSPCGCCAMSWGQPGVGCFRPVSLSPCWPRGSLAHRLKESLASAAFLAGAALAVAPCTLSLLGEVRILAEAPPKVVQLFPGAFSNQQVTVASGTALIVSAASLGWLKMTGFAWTTAALATTSYLSVLLLFNWLDQKPEIQALWCLPLVALEPVALLLERVGRVRWTLPVSAGGTGRIGGRARRDGLARADSANAGARPVGLALLERRPAAGLLVRAERGGVSRAYAGDGTLRQSRLQTGRQNA